MLLGIVSREPDGEGSGPSAPKRFQREGSCLAINSASAASDSAFRPRKAPEQLAKGSFKVTPPE